MEPKEEFEILQDIILQNLLKELDDDSNFIGEDNYNF